MTLQILIADDSEGVRNGIKDLLSSESGWLVCGEATDGEQACTMALQLRPDVILLDLSISGASGLAFATRLQETLPSADLVIMSQQEPMVLRRIADSVQLEHYIAKSSLGRDLITSLERIARRREQSQSTQTSE